MLINSINIGLLLVTRVIRASPGLIAFLFIGKALFFGYTLVDFLYNKAGYCAFARSRYFRLGYNIIGWG